MMTLARASLRHWQRHPWHLILSVLGVALGVAVVLAVDLATAGAQRAFELSASAVTGNATHVITGGPAGLPDALYRRLRVDLGVHASAPLVEAYVSSERAGDAPLHLLGIDPLAQGAFDAAPAIAGDALARLLTTPFGVALDDTLAQRLGVRVGDTLGLLVGGHRRALRVVAVQHVDRPGLNDALVTDIASAQALLGLSGQVTRIDLRLPDGPAGTAVLDRIRRVLPDGASLSTAASRGQAFTQMTHAFRLNLTALGLLVLVVGLFLIYNTMTFSVVQRRAHIAILRALGATRAEVYAWISLEAAMIGVLGTVFGLVGGMALGTGLIHLVTRTINDLYFVVSVRALTLAPLSLMKGAALGVFGTLIAAAVPAWEATRTHAASALRRSSLERDVRRLAPWAAFAGLVLAVIAAIVLAAARHSLVVSYAGLFLVMLAFALATPLAVIALMALARSAMRPFGTLAGLAPRSVSAALSRTGVAVAALAIAVAATVAIGTMIVSFRSAFVVWLGHTLRADIYVTAPSAGAAVSTALDARAIAVIARTPGMGTVTYGRRIRVTGPSGPVDLFALNTTREHFRNFDFSGRDPDAVWRAFRAGAVIVSQPYAEHHDVRVGDRVSLPTAHGAREFPVAGIFVDYGADQGVVTLDLDTYARAWNDARITSLGIYLPPQSDVDAVIARLRESTASIQTLVFQSNRALRERSLAIFDRTFAVTAVMRVLTGVVAFIGVLSALMAWQLERARELAVLRAIGVTPRQLAVLVTTETGLMGLAAGLLSLPLGVALAALLVGVINVRSFGWRMALAVDPMLLLHALALAVAAALLAGLYPAVKMARTSPALALREE